MYCQVYTTKCILSLLQYSYTRRYTQSTPYCILFAHLVWVALLPKFEKKTFCCICFISTHTEAGGKPWQHHLYQKLRRSAETTDAFQGKCKIKVLKTETGKKINFLFLNLVWFRPKLWRQHPRMEWILCALLHEIDLDVSTKRPFSYLHFTCK